MPDRPLRNRHDAPVTAEPDARTEPALSPTYDEVGDAPTQPAMRRPTEVAEPTGSTGPAAESADEDEPAAYAPVGRPLVEVEPDPKAVRRLNLLFVATSVMVLIVSVERFSFTTHIFLRPANFLRLHEAVQMVVIIPATILVQAGLLWAVSHRFTTLSMRPLLLFVLGVCFTATGNGVHELGSATLQTYCDLSGLGSDNLCGGLYLNDFYTGNAMFFAGALMTTTALLMLERCAPQGAGFSTPALVVVLVNALVYATAMIAYAGFDQVLVGFAFIAVIAFVALAYVSTTGREWRRYPFTVYTAVTFVLGTGVAAVVREFVTGWPGLPLR
jgi:hypothetical protein